MSEAMLQNFSKQIADIKKQFMSSENREEQNRLIKQMRVIHGRAIAMHEKNVHDTMNNSDDKFLEISLGDSLLYVMHRDIRACETALYIDMGKRPADKFATLLSTELFGPSTDKSGAKKVTATIKGREIEVSGMTTPQATEYPGRSDNLLSEVKKELKKGQSGGHNSETWCFKNNLTEEIDCLKTDDIMDLLSEYNKEKKTSSRVEFDVNKPTVVLYWADWCGFSVRFKPVWDTFKSMFKNKIQILDLNVGKDEELNKLAKRVGVEGYPTIVLFKDGQMKKIVAGNMDLEGVKKFLNM